MATDRTYSLCDGEFLSSSSEPPWTATFQGRYFEMRRRCKEQLHRRPGRRKAVTHFSKSSRYRLLKNIAKWDWTAMGNSLFGTFTYPDSVAHLDREKRNRERFQLVRGIEKILGKKTCGVWRVEFVARKSGVRRGEVLPHLHYLFLDAGYIDFRAVRSLWRQVIQCAETPQIDLQRVAGSTACTLYVAKYCGKVPPPNRLDKASYHNSHGRHYGYVRPAQIPKAPCYVKEIWEEGEAVYIRLKGSTVLPWIDLAFEQSFTLLGEHAERLGGEIMRFEVDATPAFC